MPNNQRNRSYGRYGGHPQSGGHRQQTPSLDEALMRFYDSEGEVRPELFDTNAQKIAETFDEAPKDANSYTQLRRFYDEVVDLQDRIEENPNAFGELLPVIRMLNAKAAYAKGRKKVDENFVKFIKTSIGQIKTAKDLHIFKTFFEAVMGFYKATKKGAKS